MKSNYNKLELCWPGKDLEIKPEPRVLIEDPEKSYGESDTGNMLIHADNLLALKALEQNFAGKIKCIYIDPPYNTGSAFEHYDDGLEHSLWLSLMKPRLDILKSLLHNNGSIWISIDDTEYAYLRVLLDEIFGRNNFITTIIWEKRKTRENRRVFSFKHDYILVYAKDRKKFEDIRNPLILSKEVLKRYKNPDNDIRGLWQSISALAQSGHATVSQFYTLNAPNGKQHSLPEGNCWRYTQNRMNEAILDNRIWFGKDGNNVPRIKKYLNESEDAGLTPETIWYADEVGTTDTAKKQSLDIFNGITVFSTPKPEELIQRIFHIATNENDIILDSFLGSGTSTAVAHKMNRKWIGIELGEHCNTHCLPRLKAVCDGTDQGGVSIAQEWKGGGGFKFYGIAPSILNKDKHDQWVISPNYNVQLLAAAMARHQGFTYCPDETTVWKQGFATEHHYIFTTTNIITPDVVEQILSEMKPEESLRICCVAFKEECFEISSRIEIVKIPDTILGKCEFGNEDYSTNSNIINMPADPDKPAFVPSYVSPEVKPSPAKIKKEDPTQFNLLF